MCQYQPIAGNGVPHDGADDTFDDSDHEHWLEVAIHEQRMQRSKQRAQERKAAADISHKLLCYTVQCRERFVHEVFNTSDINN